MTFKDLVKGLQALSRTNAVFNHFQGHDFCTHRKSKTLNDEWKLCSLCRTVCLANWYL